MKTTLKPLIDCKESCKKLCNFCNSKNLACYISSNNIRVQDTEKFIDIDFINYEDTIEKIKKFFNI